MATRAVHACAGLGVIGTLNGTETISGRVVVTSTGRHFTGVSKLLYRIDFADGSNLLASQREPLTFTANGPPDVVTFGGTLLAKGTLYAGNGTVLGYEMFHDAFVPPSSAVPS